MARERKLGGVWACAVGAAAILRLIGIRWGWPGTYNADEPHLVNLALSFGAGTLRPYLFKYPTLWPYALFAAYGGMFVAWSAAGLRHGLSEFAALYAWRPGNFFLIGRLLAAACSLGAAEVLRRTEKDLGRGAPWGALLLAFSPVVVELAHSCKPDCLMLLLAALGWRAALRLAREGGRRAHWACGAWLGLALSTQYTAAPVVLLVPLAHFLCAKRQPRRWLAEGLGAWAAAFLAGTPFALLDAPRFLLSLRDIAELNRMLPYDAAAMGREVLRNLLTMGAPTSAAGLFALAGAFQLGARRRGRLAALLAVPILAQAVVVWSSPEGGWARYLLAVFPALALLAGEGVEAARRPALRSLLGAVLVLPGFAASAALAYGMTLPDTRAEAARWIEAHVPAGKTVLLDEEHASPRLVMAQGEAAELAGKLAAAGSPRARLYRAMAEHHPGGGYRILRMRRSALDLHAYPRHVDLSQAEAPMVDVSSGLAAARAAGVDYVVTSSHGLEPGRSPEAAKFFDELRRTRLLKELRPLEGEREGPVLRIYGLPAGQRLDAPGGRS